MNSRVSSEIVVLKLHAKDRCDIWIMWPQERTTAHKLYFTLVLTSFLKWNREQSDICGIVSDDSSVMTPPPPNNLCSNFLRVSEVFIVPSYISNHQKLVPLAQVKWQLSPLGNTIISGTAYILAYDRWVKMWSNFWIELYVSHPYRIVADNANPIKQCLSEKRFPHWNLIFPTSMTRADKYLPSKFERLKHKINEGSREEITHPIVYHLIL
jgi:hypothetical protein